MTTVVLYDGPDGIEIPATAYRLVHYKLFRENPAASRLRVSPSMALAMRSDAESIAQDLKTSDGGAVREAAA